MDFSLETLTAAINEIPHLPTQLGDSGLYEYDGVATLSVEIEKKGFDLEVVSTAARGASGEAMGRSIRDIRPFKVPHIPLFDQVLADEVQGVRLFGTSDQPEPLETRINEVLAIGKGRLDYTLEAHRVGGLKGIVYDKDGSVLYNFFDEFGVVQQTLSFALGSDATKVRAKCDEALDKSGDVLGGVMMTGAIGWCGKDFFRGIIDHKETRESYLGQAEAAQLRGALPGSFDYGGINFRRYRGKIGANPMIADNECYIVPTGVPQLFIGRFAPAPYNETVNTKGLPFYAKAMEKRNGTGYDLEMQTNPLHVCTRPRAIIKATVA